ncbi:MAG: hypothetical protein AB7I18_11230 [Candidatus Berkiella sp.]
MWLKEAVQREHPEALFLMATLHNTGRSHPFVEKNEALALELIGKSAKLGYAPAQKLIFKEDLNVGIDRKTINTWMARLALEGDKEAEAYYIWVLESLGKNDEVRKFQQLILDMQNPSQKDQPTKVAKKALSTTKSPKSKSEVPSRVLTPQYSSVRKKPKNPKVEQDKSLDTLASAVGAIAISETNTKDGTVRSNEPTKPVSTKRKRNRMKAKR